MTVLGAVFFEAAFKGAKQPLYFLSVRRLRDCAKSILDRIGALILLVMLAPIFAILAYKTARDGGPVFYGHQRIGKNGENFKCWKFRSMVINADQVLTRYLAKNPAAREQWHTEHKLKDDPRVTPFGRFLRTSSLDELPQLWNVLKGEMSLVGPRPVIAQEQAYYGAHWAQYLSVKPGMTGLWQVSGRSETGYKRRVRLDVEYVYTRSLRTDLVILIKTIAVVLKRSGAY